MGLEAVLLDAVNEIWVDFERAVKSLKNQSSYLAPMSEKLLVEIFMGGLPWVISGPVRPLFEAV